jgi:MoaA/NifB/PqqE/SkfB family radical SAM enzyme
MIKYEEIKNIHLELTERCQAECPMCPRTGNPLVGKRELSLTDIEIIFPKEFIKQLVSITVCGNFGEPVLAKDFIEIIQYFKFTNKNLYIKVQSNAGARDEIFWKDLAYLIGDTGIVLFGIDGLEDTNHIYRKKVQWNKVMQSAQSFIGAGGKAQWDYLVFEHNEHQVDDARALAKKMRFYSFQLKITNRWDRIFDGLSPSKIYKSEKLNLFESFITENFYDSVAIDCKSIKYKSLYVSAEGLLFPCCYTASPIYAHNNDKKDRKKIHIDLIGNKDNINIKLKSIKQIIEEKNLEKYVETWDKPSIKEGKLFTCSRSCNAKIDPYQAQLEKIEVL